MTFAVKTITVTFTLGTGDFVEGGNSVTLTGKRVSARLVHAGGSAMPQAVLEIYGMTLSEMNQLSTLGMRVRVVGQNSVKVEAGDFGSTLSTVFVGTIYQAWINFEDPPNVSFHVEASSMFFDAVGPATATSYKGGVDVSTVLTDLAGKMKLAFQNNGVSVVLANPYLHGSYRDQALAVVRAAGIVWNGGENGILAIWPAGTAVANDAVIVSSSTGLVGYPSYTIFGIGFQSLFNPGFRFGGKITMQSSLQAACGDYTIYSLDRTLEAGMPHGQWFDRIEASSFGQPVPMSS